MYNASQEYTLIKFLLDRDNYKKYYRFIKALNLEPEVKLLVQSVHGYFKQYPDTDTISVDDLVLYINTKNPTAKQGEIFDSIVTKLRNSKVNSELIKENFNSILEYYYGSEIVYNITSRIEDKDYGFLSEAKKSIEEFEELRLKLNDVNAKFVPHNIAEFVKNKVQQPGLSWRVSCLNYHIGELKGKSLGHVFARVDTGKTSFILSEEANWVKQLKEGEYIAHFNNEEDGVKIIQRFAQAVLGCTKEELEANPEECEKKYLELGGDKLLLYDSAMISIEDIESVLQEYNVKIVVVDQSDKLQFKGDKSLNDVGRLQNVYARLRDLAKKYGCDILTVGQASQSAHDRKWIDTTDIDGSKTLKPGEFDYIIGIGKVLQEVESTTEFRYIHLCKNKMGTGQHAKQEVIIDTTRAVYYDIAEFAKQGGGYVGRKTSNNPIRNFGSDQGSD